MHWPISFVNGILETEMNILVYTAATDMPFVEFLRQISARRPYYVSFEVLITHKIRVRLMAM
jgi:hypothetical protein